VTGRKAVQILTLLGFLALFVASRRGGWPADLVNLPMRLDPLATLAHLLASRTLLAGSAVALLTVLLTLLVGRAWCGWLCPLGTLLDLFPLERWRRSRTRSEVTPAEGWRKVKHALLLAVLFAALLTNLSLLVFDPLTILLRGLSTGVWPALDRVFTVTETVLYQGFPDGSWLQSVLGEAILAIDRWARPAAFPLEPVYYRAAWIYLAFLVAVIALNVFASRTWCRYACPLGALLGLLSKAALIRRVVGPECKGCLLCTRACPTGTIRAEKDYASDPAECTVCMECLEACPRGGIRFHPNIKMALWNEYDPSRRQALITMGAVIAGVALAQSDLLAKRESPYLLRPPGGRENNLLNQCLRCGECVRSCPTSAIQPSLLEGGLTGLWTPMLIPRLGYCDYSCNACGQVCPVEAIPPLSLEEKRLQVIGLAYVDTDRCIAWADHQDCIVCEEMCPLPEKAIWLEQAEVNVENGQRRSVNLPHVDRERCIGCGICEYKCPVNGTAAIRVYVPNRETI
jgi:polyferredoxin